MAGLLDLLNDPVRMGLLSSGAATISAARQNDQRAALIGPQYMQQLAQQQRAAQEFDWQKQEREQLEGVKTGNPAIDSLPPTLRAQVVKQLFTSRYSSQEPSSVREYEYAKQNGFDGSFQDWVVAGGQSSRPSAVQEWDFYSKLPEKQQALYLEMKRNPNMVVKDVGNVPTVIAPRVAGTTTTPLSTLQSEATGAATVAGAQTAAQEAAKTAADKAAKVPAVNALDYVAEQITAANKEVATGGAFGAVGALSKVFDYEDASYFDNLQQQISTELRTVFRIPGEGSLSDREQAQYGLQLPSRNFSPEKNAQIMLDLRTRARIRTGGAAQSPSGGAAPAGGGIKFLGYEG